VAEGAGGRGQRLWRQWQWRRQPMEATAGAGNSGRSKGSARADNNQPKSGSKDVQNITLNVIIEHHAVAAEGAGGRGQWLRRQWQWRQQPTAVTAGAGNSGRSGGSARADNNQPKSGSKDIFKILL
jgi:hypothetical protein